MTAAAVSVFPVPVAISKRKRLAPALTARAPDQTAPAARPEQIVPLLAARGLAGEIRVWYGVEGINGNVERLLPAVANQMTLALDRLTPA